MALIPGGIALWVILVAPGFISVMTTIILSAIEREFYQYTLLVWSLVSSLLIDIAFLVIYQEFWGDPIELFEAPKEILFSPSLRVDMLLVMVSLSVALGVIYTAGHVYQVTRKFRGLFWYGKEVKGHPGQPWQNLLSNAKQIQVKTSDDEIYIGHPVRWNNEHRKRELVIASPHRLNQNSLEYESVYGDRLFFDGEDIQRVTLQKNRSGQKPTEEDQVSAEEPAEEGEKERESSDI